MMQCGNVFIMYIAILLVTLTSDFFKLFIVNASPTNHSLYKVPTLPTPFLFGDVNESIISDIVH